MNKVVHFKILSSKLCSTIKCSVKSPGLITSDLQCIYGTLHRSFSNKGAEEAEEAWPRRVVSGLQPTGELHVGNYFGALRRCVQLQNRGEDVMVFIADLHSFTGRQSKEEAGRLPGRTLQAAAAVLAAGLRPERGALFVQSAVARHAELCWLLACLATQARLAHLPQYKEKAAALKEVPVGLLLYPVLQAADILVYRGTHVPVGADQVQHLQLAAQLVRTFHHRFGRAFPTPRALLPDDGSDRIRSLRDPSKKMSKSDPDPKSRILLTDCDETIRRKIRKAVTDCTPQVTFEPERAGVANLVRLHCLARALQPHQALREAAGLTTAQYKEVVASALCGCLAPVRARLAELSARPQPVRDALQQGAERARRRADRVHARVAELTGLAPGVAHHLDVLNEHLN